MKNWMPANCTVISLLSYSGMDYASQIEKLTTSDLFNGILDPYLSLLHHSCSESRLHYF